MEEVDPLDVRTRSQPTGSRFDIKKDMLMATLGNSACPASKLTRDSTSSAFIQREFDDEGIFGTSDSSV
jgi:hypothetical protein